MCSVPYPASEEGGLTLYSIDAIRSALGAHDLARNLLEVEVVRPASGPAVLGPPIHLNVVAHFFGIDRLIAVDTVDYLASLVHVVQYTIWNRRCNTV